MVNLFRSRTTLIACFALARTSRYTTTFAFTNTSVKLPTSTLAHSILTTPLTTSSIHTTTTTTLRSSSSSSNNDDASTMTQKKTVLVPIADGSEEIETTCIQDTLVRFGAQVTVASVMDNDDDSLVCKMSRGIKFMADCSIQDAVKQDYDLIVLPGGMPGAEHLRDCKPLQELLQKQKAGGKYYGAICAAPAVALKTQGLIEDGTVATCYPAPKFIELLNKDRVDSKVVVTENLITSQGPGTALEFGLTLGELLYGKEKRDEIAKQMLFP